MEYLDQWGGVGWSISIPRFSNSPPQCGVECGVEFLDRWGGVGWSFHPTRKCPMNTTNREDGDIFRSRILTSCFRQNTVLNVSHLASTRTSLGFKNRPETMGSARKLTRCGYLRRCLHAHVFGCGAGCRSGSFGTVSVPKARLRFFTARILVESL